MDKITATLSGNKTNAMQTAYSNNAELKIDIPYSSNYVTYRLQIIAYTNNVVTGKKITSITACRNKTFGEATTEVLADGTAMLGGVVTGIVNGAFVQPVMAAASGIDFIINIKNPEQYESNQKWRDGLIEKAENFMISNLPAEQYYYYNCGIEGGEISELCVGSVYAVKGVMGVVTKLENMGRGVKGAQMLLDSGDEVLMMAGKDSKNVAVVAAKNIDGASTIYKSIEEGLNFDATALGHLEEPSRFVPIQMMIDTIKTGKSMPDPRGLEGFMMYYKQIIIHNKLYNLEVLYNAATNTVRHFKYARNAMGPLAEIIK